MPKNTATAMPTTPTMIPATAPASRCPPPDNPLEPLLFRGAEPAGPEDVEIEDVEIENVELEDVGPWVIHS